MANLERQRSYTPRRTREKRAYQLLVTGSVTGLVGVVGLVLAVVGVIGAGLPIVLLVVAVMCALFFRRTVSG